MEQNKSHDKYVEIIRQIELDSFYRVACEYKMDLDTFFKRIRVSEITHSQLKNKKLREIDIQGDEFQDFNSLFEGRTP